VLRLMLSLALRAGALKANPVIDVKVARMARAEMILVEMLPMVPAPSPWHCNSATKARMHA
jgi:hypothetical protein